MANFSLIAFESTKNKTQYPFLLEATITLSADSLYLGYQITQDLSSLDLGPYTPHHERLMNLWEKTCFEFFLAHPNGHYIEFNFSPNFEWNAFYFEQIRGPLSELPLSENPQLDILNSNDKFFLVATIKLNLLPEIFRNEIKNCQFGVTSILMDKNQTKSYWALTHKDSKPNFHMYESFIGKF